MDQSISESNSASLAALRVATTTSSRSSVEVTSSVGLCALVVIVAWLPRLFWGFWTDETATWWMASHGWQEAIARTLTWDGQSVLYSIVESFFRTDSPYKELIMRLPSAASIVLAAVLLYRLAERQITKGAGMIAVAAFFCTPSTVEAATNARPYALALAATLFSFSKFLDWIDSGKFSDWVGYVAAGILVVYLHYLFAFVLGVQFLVLIYCAKRPHAVQWGAAAGAVCVWALALIPLSRPLVAMFRGSDVYVNAVPPTFLQLLSLCFPLQVLIAAVLSGALIAVRYTESLRLPVRLAGDRIFLLFTWAFLAPIAFFAAARLTGTCIFATRYLLFASPAAFLLLAWAASGLKLQARMLVVVAIFGATTLSIGSLQQAYRPSATDWRAPLARIAQVADHNDPVFIPSPFNNANSRDWKAGNTPRSYLFAPLDTYPAYNHVLPLPYFVDPAAEQYASDIVRSQIKNQRFFLIAAKDSEFAQSFTGTLDALGFHHSRETVNDYLIFSFQPAVKSLQ